MHRVKCLKCEKYFDADIVPYVKFGRRYGHSSCYPDIEQVQALQEEQDEVTLFYRYAKEILKDEFNYVKIKRQVDAYLIDPYNFTYQGMMLSMKYWYEVKKNSIDKSRGAIGIIPYIYNDARKYFLTIYNAQQANKDKEIKTQIRKVVIPIPKGDAPKIKLFNF